MKLYKAGRDECKKPTLKFTHKKCGGVFSAEAHEYQVEPVLSAPGLFGGIQGGIHFVDRKTVTCPWCGETFTTDD